MNRKKSRKKRFTAAPRSTLCVNFCNIRGLHSNLNAVHHHLETIKPALLFLFETQISTPDDTSYLNYPGYKLEHVFSPRAGVCVYIRADICGQRLHRLEVGDLSLLWLRVDHGGQTRVYACLYRSHSGNAETDRLFDHVQRAVDFVLEQTPTAEVVILGDFNAHHVEWLGSRITDHAGRSAHNFVLAYDFKQLVSQPTRIPDISSHSPSVLDLFLTTHPTGYQVRVDVPLGTSDHCLVQTSVDLTSSIRTRETSSRRVWHYKSADWDGLREFYASYPWGRLCFSENDPNICAEAVADAILQGMECYIPTSLIPIRERAQKWFNGTCNKAASLKQTYYRSWASAHRNKDLNISDLKRKYNAASRSYKNAIARAKFNHIDGIGRRLMAMPSGSRAFWSLSKAIQGNFCRSSFPALRKPDDTLAHTAKEKAEILGTIFAANSMLDDGRRTPPTIPQCQSQLQDIRFTQSAVRKALFSLDVNKASGPDGIPAVVLKKCAPELTPVLKRLFQLSYSSSSVPDSWKIALVHPIPKKGDNTDPSNYRPIAITSLLSKVMEQIINSQLLTYLEGHQLISDRQYGFRHGRSAGDLLVYLTHRWAEAIDSKGEALAVSLDIAKAFDRVWHGALLSKLPSYGLPEKLCNWVASFLDGRSIKVAVDGFCSEPKPINAGVPQGSVLSPTLFILHINDMLHNNTIHCYADDSTGDALYKGQPSRAKLEEFRAKLVSDIETSLEQVSEWGSQNIVEFNPSKTQVCAFSAKKTPFSSPLLFQNIPLTPSNSIGILGVRISDNVQFRDHLEGKAKLASKKLGVLNRAMRYFAPNHRLLLYKAQVRPHMEYCSHLWAGAPQYQLLPFDRIQKRAVRLVDNPKLTDSLESLDHRRDVGSLCVFYRLYNGECSEELFDLIPPSLFYNRTARHRKQFHPHHLGAWCTSTSRCDRSFFPRTCKLWNQLPPTVFPLNYNMGLFKGRINKFLKSRQRISGPSGAANVHGRW